MTLQPFPQISVPPLNGPDNSFSQAEAAVGRLVRRPAQSTGPVTDAPFAGACLLTYVTLRHEQTQRSLPCTRIETGRTLAW